MFDLFTPIFDWVSTPYLEIANNFQTSTFLYPFFLGLYCAFLQSQLIWNICAVVFFMKEAIERKKTLYIFLCFLLGKMFMYSLFGVIIWTSGRPPESAFLDYFPSIKLIYGLALIFVGFISFDLFKLPFITKWLNKIPTIINNPYTKTFILGMIFSFSFGDKVMSIFFEDIMNLVLTSPVGSAIPSIFAIGTAIPILLIVILLFIIVRMKDVAQVIRKFHPSAMKFVALFMIVIGFYEIFLL